jgi:hypothetical protein
MSTAESVTATRTPERRAVRAGGSEQDTYDESGGRTDLVVKQETVQVKMDSCPLRGT